jgi:uncharacterized lipoprotein YmbA
MECSGLVADTHGVPHFVFIRVHPWFSCRGWTEAKEHHDMNMKENFRRAGARWLALAGLGLTLSACALPEAVPDLTRFYVLTPAAAEGEVKVNADAGGMRTVAIRSVVVPEFLRGKMMQVRLAANEVKFVDVARWAEPLEAGLQRVVRENLARRAGVRVVARGGEPHDYDVAIHLRHCEGVLPAGVARLEARVEIFSTGLEARLVADDDFVAEISGWDGNDYGQLAAKLSEAAAGLSERVAALLPAERS